MKIVDDAEIGPEPLPVPGFAAPKRTQWCAFRWPDQGGNHLAFGVRDFPSSAEAEAYARQSGGREPGWCWGYYDPEATDHAPALTVMGRG